MKNVSNMCLNLCGEIYTFDLNDADYHGRVFTLGVSKPAVKTLMEEARKNYSALGAADEEIADEDSGPSDASCYRVVTPPVQTA